MALPTDKEIEDRIVDAMRRYFLRFTDAVVARYHDQIENAVRWYVKSLPRHIATSETDDLASEARIAFIDAIKTWDPRKGDLWPFASMRVKGAMQDYLRRRGNDPIAGIYDFITQAAYVYMAFNNEEIVHESSADTTMQLDEALNVLSDTEKTVINKYYKEDKTFKEIGKELEPPLSESQVSRICKTATAKMKKTIKKEG